MGVDFRSRHSLSAGGLGEPAESRTFVMNAFLCTLNMVKFETGRVFKRREKIDQVLSFAFL